MPTVLRPIGHEGTTLQLKQLWAGGAGPRTLLFAGPASVGRRPTARWLAAYVNCAQSDNGPCGECESCQLLIRGAHPDLKEVAPATTTGAGRAKRALEIRIDQLVFREGKEPEPLSPWLQQRPRFNVRVGIIDHAEAMAAPAANSILKLLEEPPSWALIVLIAPGPESVLPTVASRSSTVRFRPVPADLLTHLPGAHADHPALVLGQPGLLLAGTADDTMARLPLGSRAAESDAEAAAGHDSSAQEAARKAAADLLAAVNEDLQALVTAAEEFATAQSDATSAGTEPTPLAWLRHELRVLDPTRYATASEAVNRCEDALAHYAQAPLATTVLALELRNALTGAMPRERA